MVDRAGLYHLSGCCMHPRNFSNRLESRVLAFGLSSSAIGTLKVIHCEVHKKQLRVPVALISTTLSPEV